MKEQVHGKANFITVSCLSRSPEVTIKADYLFLRYFLNVPLGIK